MKKRKRLFIFIVSLVLTILVLPKFFSPTKQPLELLTFSPQGEKVDVDTVITLELTAPPDIATLEQHFTINPAVPGQLTVDDSTILFTPEAPLQYSTHYAVTVTEGVQTKQGSVLDEPLTLAFTTTDQPPLTIMAMGDIMLDQLTRQKLKEYDPTYPFLRVKELLKQGDVIFGNLETPISARGTPLAGKKYTFSAAPFSVQCLEDAGINMVSLANNHIMDYGEEALSDTLNILAEHNITSAGAGMNSTQAHSGTILEIQGYRVALLAYTDDFAVPAQHRALWQASEQKPGAAIVHDTNRIKADIQRLRTKADLVMVSFHWGYEYTTNVAAEQQKLGHLAIDAGADLILGHHPHVPQGVEIYKGKPIVYSLSNFVFYPFANRPETQDTFILQAKYENGRITALSLIPILGGNSQPYLPQGQELDALTSRLAQLLPRLGTSFEVTTDSIIQIKLPVD
ncbi:MAG TPA: CapA family protein [Oscillospiraceae bacterium]|nr:CapA family protein [Oscillospiraceae bacterium]